MAQQIKKTPPKQAIDISSVPTPRLKSLIQEIEVELKKREKEDRKKALARFQEVAAEYGLTLEDVLADKKKFTKREYPALPPKYINPDNPGQSWNGRGPRPKWLKSLIEGGKSLDELTLNPPKNNRS